MPSKVERLIGLATGAGKVITGLELCEKAVKTGKAKLVILTNETSENSKKVFINSKVDIIYLETKEDLGRCTGKETRSVAVITDKNFSTAVLKAYNDKEI